MPRCPVEDDTAQNHSSQIPHPQIPAANAEGKNKPGPAEGYEKYKVCQRGQPGPQGPEKTVKSAQARAQCHSPQDPDPCQLRGDQRRKRPKMPRSRSSS